MGIVWRLKLRTPIGHVFSGASRGSGWL